MRILFISHLPLDPVIGGGVSRVFNLLRQAAGRHSVTVVVPCAPGGEDSLRRTLAGCAAETFTAALQPPLGAFKGISTVIRLALGRSAGWDMITPSLQHSVDCACADRTFDLVHLSTPFLIRLRLPLNCAVVADAQNVEWDNIRRGLQEARTIRQRMHFTFLGMWVRFDENRCCRQSSIVTAVSGRDRLLFRRDLPELPVAVVPNGVDTDYFSASVERPREKGLMVFTGSMDYHPNEHAAIWMTNDIFPLIQRCIAGARLAIVGANPPRSVTMLASPCVDVTGKVDDVRPWLARGEIAVVPLRIGGGTRLKILEAMAAGIPVVSTALGCEGLDVENGLNILIADDPQSFAAAVMRLHRNPQLRMALSQAGRTLVLERYRWSVIGESLEAAYRTAVAWVPDHGCRSEGSGQNQS